MNDLYLTPIIIVDQDLGFVDEITLLLNTNGFQNIHTSEPDVISNLIKNKPIPYLIIMECQFEDMDGNELIESIKFNCRDASVIVVSNTKKLVDGFNCLKNGATSFFRKEEIRNTPKVLLDSVLMSLEFNNRRIILKKQIDTIYESAIVCM